MSTKKTYAEKLKDPRWQRKRTEVLTRDSFACAMCDDVATELHVHHLKYHKSGNPWETDLSDLLTLCKECHFVIEDLKKTQDCRVDSIGKNNYHIAAFCEYSDGVGMWLYARNGSGNPERIIGLTDGLIEDMLNKLRKIKSPSNG